MTKVGIELLGQLKNENKNHPTEGCVGMVEGPRSKRLLKIAVSPITHSLKAFKKALQIFDNLVQTKYVFFQASHHYLFFSLYFGNL